MRRFLLRQAQSVRPHCRTRLPTLPTLSGGFGISCRYIDSWSISGWHRSLCILALFLTPLATYSVYAWHIHVRFFVNCASQQRCVLCLLPCMVCRCSPLFFVYCRPILLGVFFVSVLVASAACIAHLGSAGVFPHLLYPPNLVDRENATTLFPFLLLRRHLMPTRLPRAARFLVVVRHTMPVSFPYVVYCPE